MSGKQPIIDPAGSQPPSSRRGGGCLIAIGLVTGPLVGMYFHETSLGLLIGFGLGAAAAIVMAVADRRR